MIPLVSVWCECECGSEQSGHVTTIGAGVQGVEDTLTHITL